MYGKIQPGTYHPYRCTRKNGSSPGCKYIYRSLIFECVIISSENVLLSQGHSASHIDKVKLKMDKMCTVKKKKKAPLASIM